MVVWLKMTDYMHGWLQHELGCALMIKEQHVVCVQHLEGARDVFRMESSEEELKSGPIGISISCIRKNCIDAGMDIDQETVEKAYGVSKKDLKLFVPIECPKMCMTVSGVLRPWTEEVNFGQHQATALQKLLRGEFWKAVESFDKSYAAKMDGKKYPAVNMIEAFCAETKTSDEYVEYIRREWQRRQKRKA